MPDFDFRTTKRFDVIAHRLASYCGISRDLVSKRLHRFKEDWGLAGDHNVIFDLSGGVYILEEGDLEYLGTLTTGGAKERA